MPKGSYNSFIHVDIGGLKLHQTEDHIMSLQHKRIASDMSGNVILTIYDDTAFAVEAKILGGETEFSYQYGYVNGSRSKKFTAMISHVGAEMTAKGMILTVEGVPSGSDATNTAEIKSYSGMTIDQIVALIASQQGWNIKINVPCKPIYIDAEATEQELKTYIQDGLGAEEFIRTKLIPDAVSLDGNMGDYEFYLETTDAGKFMSFLPKGYQSDNISASFTFIVGQDNERIISFNPDYDKLLVALIGGGGVEASVSNPSSNEAISYDVLKKKTTASETRVTTRIAGSSYSASELEALAINTWNKLANLNYKAVLQLVGDTTLSPMDYINVIVLTPSNTLHHTSGRYYINNIEDMVDTGSFISTLELTKVNDSNYDSVSMNSSPTPSRSPYQTNNSNISEHGIPNTDLNNLLLGYLGIPYVWGGESRSGADCSGFVNLVFNENGLGSNLQYRDTASGYWSYMANNPSLFTPVSQSELQSGDIIVMDNGGHIGIALGNGKMIHASSGQGKVVVASLWKFTAGYRYNGYPSGMTSVRTVAETAPSNPSAPLDGNTNSSLASVTIMSPNKTSPRNHVIDTITIHCMAGNMSVESCGNMFAQSSRGASSNYGIGSDGRVALYVDESDRSWCTSSSSNDHRAVTIEVASDSTHPYKVTDAAYSALIDLVADICWRNGISKLIWADDKSLIGQPSRQNMTIHRWFAQKACPGDYLYDLHDDIVSKVNAKL